MQKIWSDRSISKTTKMIPDFPYISIRYGNMNIKSHGKEADMIPWTDRRNNIFILEELGIQKRLSTVCLQHILRHLGHIARKLA